jgi:hypothetical protein
LVGEPERGVAGVDGACCDGRIRGKLGHRTGGDKTWRKTGLRVSESGKHPPAVAFAVDPRQKTSTDGDRTWTVVG